MYPIHFFFLGKYNHEAILLHPFTEQHLMIYLKARFTRVRLCSPRFAWAQQLVHLNGMPCLLNRRKKVPAAF